MDDKDKVVPQDTETLFDMAGAIVDAVADAFGIDAGNWLPSPGDSRRPLSVAEEDVNTAINAVFRIMAGKED